MIHPLVVLSLNLLDTQCTFESICVSSLCGHFIIYAMTIFSGDYSVDYSFVYPNFLKNVLFIYEIGRERESREHKQEDGERDKGRGRSKCPTEQGPCHTGLDPRTLGS